jgi:hypothetical protein
MIKIKGSGSESASESGSISQRHGSADPDPNQNVMDPQDWWQVPVIRMMLGLELLSGRGAAGGSPFSPALSGNLIWTSKSRVTVCTFEPFAPITVLKKGEDGGIYQNDAFQRVPSNTKLLHVFVRDMIPHNICPSIALSP